MTERSADVQESTNTRQAGSPEAPLVQHTPFGSVPDPAGRAEQLAAVRGDKSKPAAGSDQHDFALVGDANGQALAGAETLAGTR